MSHNRTGSLILSSLLFASLFFSLNVSAQNLLMAQGPSADSEIAPIFIPHPTDPRVRADNGEEPKAQADGLKKPGEVDPIAVEPPKGKVPANLLSFATNPYFSRFALVFDKSSRTLTVWKKSGTNIELVKALPADMGQAEGNKTALGDKKTPEGIYFFQQYFHGRDQLDFNQYGSAAFTMDYPNFFDLQDKKTGHGIWLHAIPDNKSLRRGSRGCIVLRDSIIQTMGQFIDFYQTPVVVDDKVEWIEADSLNKQKQTIEAWLEKWRTDWSSKNVDTYITHYDQQFQSQGMKLTRWKTYKQGLTEKYKFMNIEILNPTIYKHDNQLIVRFLQKYSSDMKSDFGEKTLYVYQYGQDYKIVGEFWKAIENPERFQAGVTASAIKDSPGAATASATEPSNN